MDALDWGMTTEERNINIDKYYQEQKILKQLNYIQNKYRLSELKGSLRDTFGNLTNKLNNLRGLK